MALIRKAINTGYLKMAIFQRKMSLEKSAKIILKDCMNLQGNESCLIVTDSNLKLIGEILLKNSLEITKKSKLILMEIPDAHGTEPPAEIAEEMLKYNVVLLPTTKSLSHTKARNDASHKGARIATLPGITEDMMQRTLDVDFQKIKEMNHNLISKLKDKKQINISTELGTNLRLGTENREWISDNGFYNTKGAFGNLPAGEVFIAPLENTANGTLIVDASVGGLGIVDNNMGISINHGFIENIEGGKVAKLFKNSLKNRFYKNVAELGIGTNYKAKITGNVLEDEKVSGTCHIAFGNNKHFGGKVDVPFHVDVVIKSPTIYADNVLLMKNGKPNSWD
ncbi:MAG: aminopeptidase [Candidatus Woesearchaeota archaeon]|jgi:leucyl aminopeptidase (aminopeptidase T)|nr:aminopeptidase [Candidatus Woesearchaeota archaeon]|tara:strand:+ start:11391 stop:12404 length:1014 start_codon:yes stop_codon:yes gene_type:complete